MQQELERLARLFLKFPGIGERQAKRFAYFILTQSEEYVSSLSKSIIDARNQAHTCKMCCRIFEGRSDFCNICEDGARDKSVLLVVEKSQDIDSFDRTDYHGIFFVLEGLIPIVQKAILKSTNVNLLVERLNTDKNIKEIILAFPLTPNGDHTDQIIREMLSSTNAKISSLGRGLSSGAELEYADTASLNASLKKRE